MHAAVSHREIIPFYKTAMFINYVSMHMDRLSKRKMIRSLTINRGFTILELIVSITILTMVALIIGQGFRIGVNSWDKGEAETTETQRLRILSTMLTQQLKSFYMYKTKLEDDETQTVLFQGEKDSILFVTARAENTYGGLKWVRYSYKEGVLYYKEGLLPDKEVMEHIEGDEETLDPEIGDVTFEYYTGTEDDWKESWDDEDSVPDSVKVKISYFQPFRINLMQATSMNNEEER